MKLAGWLLLLVACAGSDSPAPATPVSTLDAECPSCPTCETQSCPTCPQCPSPPPEPATADWHCLELTPPLNGIKSFCWSTASVCESYRQKAQANTTQYGSPSACTTQRTAFCFYLGDPNPMSRQTLCSRTPEHCEARRQANINAKPSTTTIVSKCRPLLNTDTFSYDDGNGLNPLP